MFNNKTRTFLLLTLLFVTIMGVSAATAADIDNNAADTPLITEDTTSQASIASDNSVQSDVSAKNKEITKTTTKEAKGDVETANFTTLETDINGSNVKLSKDYIQGIDESNITITSNKVIDGNGHTITTDKGMFIIENGVTLTVSNLIVSSSHFINYTYYFYDFYDKGSLILDNVTFIYNSENRTYGGQIYVDNNANLTVTNSLFDGENNVRSQIYANGNDYNITIDKSTFTNYNTQYSAIYLNKRGNLTVTNSKFINNIMSDNGGALYINANDCVALIENCTFENLTAKFRGGAIAAQYGNTSVKGSTFRNLVQTATSNNAGAIFVAYNSANLYLEDNIMENNTSVNADVYFNSGQLLSDLKVIGENVIVDQESSTTLELKVTDDNGNPVDFRISPFVIKINDETIRTTYKNGTINATVNGTYEPGKYNITITYDDTKLLGNVEIPDIKFIVNDIGLFSYANITELINSAETGETVTLDRLTLRKSVEESIVISKNGITIDLNGNTINAKGGKVFDIDDEVTEVTIKNGIITNINNTSPSLYNLQGRFITVNNTHAVIENVNFTNNIATPMSNAPGSFIFAIDSDLEIINCSISTSSGTFINNVKSNVYINGSVFKNNNLYIKSDILWNALICDGGYLEIHDSHFINNTANYAVIDGQSQTLSMFAYGSSLLFDNKELIIDNCVFKDNYASNGKSGAIHTSNDTTVTNSVFINNRMNGMINYGGAINSDNGKLTVESCLFVNNAAGYSSSKRKDGTAIYNHKGDLSIKDSLIITNITDAASVYNGAHGATIDINGNYWGNATPEGLYKSTSTGDIMTVDNWAVLNLTTIPEENIQYQENIIVKAIFTNTTDGSQITTLPDYDMVTFTANGGSITEQTVEISNNEASTTFYVENSPFTITASYPNMEVEYVGEAIMPEPEVYVLNEGNWTKFFNEDGTINKTTVVPNSELQFEGTFTDKYMIINMPVNITTAPTQATLNNCQFLVITYNVNITNLVMNSEDTEETPIIVEDANHINIESNTISVTNNENRMETRAIIIDGGSNNIIRNNTITTIGPEGNITYGSYSSINILYTASIDANSEELIIDSNKITTKKNDKEAESLGTIYGIYVHGAGNDEYTENVEICNNEIITEGDVYEYSVRVNWIKNANVHENNVTTTSNYFSSGIHVLAIEDSVIRDNTVDSKATNITYGIVLEGAMGGFDWTTYDTNVYRTKNTDVINNTVNVESFFAWAIETFAGIENTIQYNNITVNADQGLGIGLTDQESVASYNNIEVNAKMTGIKQSSYDFIDPYTTGIKLCNNGLKDVFENEITFNNVTINAPYPDISAVNITFPATENIVTDNYLLGTSDGGDYAVIVKGNSTNTIENNSPKASVITLNYGNWTEYFNEDGTPKFVVNGTQKTFIVTGSELRFEGEFNNRNMLIDKALNLTTAETQAVFKDCAFLVTADNVNITKLEMSSTDTEDALITTEDASNISIADNTLTMTNNEDLETRSIIIDGGSDITIFNNTITTIGPENKITYGADSSINKLYLTSIEATANSLTINGNKITTKPNNKEAEDYGTIFGVYIHGTDSDNFVEYTQIINNEFITEGKVYEYGVRVNYATKALIFNNTVTTTSDYYSSGIHVFAINNSMILENTVNCKAENMTYGIVLEGAMGGFDPETWEIEMFNTENTIVSNNTVNVESLFAWAIETYAGIKNEIYYNNIIVNADQGIGIGLTDQNSTAAYNTITVNSKLSGATQDSYDYISPYTTGIKITDNGLQEVSGNTAKFNNITVNTTKPGISGINLTIGLDTENTITDNYIISTLGIGDEGVITTGTQNIVKDNLPSLVITDETYSDFFDESCALKPLYNNSNLKVSGAFNDNTVFIFDAMNVTVTNDGTAVFNNGQVMTGNNATVVFNGLKFNNTMDAVVFESEGNILNNSIITINSDDEIHAIYVYNDNNIINNTLINIVAPSANVIYNPDYSVNTPAPAAIVISSNNNMIDNVGVYFNGQDAIHNPDPTAWDAPTVDGIYLVSSTTPIENNTIQKSIIVVEGCNYAYGINVGNAKNTLLENIIVDVTSDYYADAIQLFDADNITIKGLAEVQAETEAYGVYSTAMGTGFSKNIDLTGLDIKIEAAKVTGVLIEGSANVTMADATYNITGAEATAVRVAEDFMYNTPTNILIDNVEMNINGTGDNNVLDFYKADTVIITNNNIISSRGSEIFFNQTPNSQVVGNHIIINDIIFGNYAVISNEEDTIIENNTPVSQKMDEMQQTIDELQNEIDKLKAPKETTLTLDEITDARYKDNVTISGTLVNEDSIGLYNQIITLTIDGKEVNVTTKGGIFNYTTSFTQIGEKTVTATYAGTDKYQASEATTTFTVEKQDIIITYDPIQDAKYKDIINITGKITDVNGNGLNNINALIHINGKLHKAKTDKTGAFTLTTTITEVGTNTVKFSYNGNTYYNGYETTTTFNTEKQDITITYDAIPDVKYKDTITITGKITDANGNGLYNINALIKINGKLYKAKTDKTGAFTLTIKANVTGTNNVNISYGGNTNYNGAETLTTFNVEKQDVTIECDTIPETVSGEDVTITGTVKDANGYSVNNVNVNIRINGKLFKAKTDKTGAFTLTTTATTVGTNNVTLSYNGNANYNAAETNTTFTVIAKP